jgi:putative membrane protein
MEGASTKHTEFRKADSFVNNMKKANDSLFAWLLRLVKGMVIGTGFIIPGVSGGVFAAIFGVYEPMIRFFANPRKDFVKNVKFLLPIGVGVLISMVLVSKVLGGFFERAEVPLVWFFIGCVMGTLPSLYRQAGRQGRIGKHWAICGVTVTVGCVLLYTLQGWLSNVTIPTGSALTWLLAGALMGLGAIVPGLSPSNFLLYMGIYGVMMNRIGQVDLLVLIPVVLGAGLCFLSLSKVFDKLFEKAYAGIYHFILGLIIASTLMIIPWPGKVLESGATAAYTTASVFVAIGACVGGIALGYVMGILEKKYKDENE